MEDDSENKELQHEMGEMDRNEENRVTESEKNKALQQQLEVNWISHYLSTKSKRKNVQNVEIHILLNFTFKILCFS